MNVEKQRLMISYMLSSADTFAITQPIIQHTYFDPLLRNTMEFILDYYKKYSSLPNPTQIKAETGQEFETQPDVKPDQIKYFTSEIEAFCKRKAIEQAIAASPKLIAEGKYGEVENKIKAAVLTAIRSELGLNYYDKPLDRLESMLSDPDRIPTGFGKAFDDAIGGGLQLAELILFTANSGGGKSISLQNLALNFAAQGYDVLYISLELSEKMISQRLDQMHSGIATREWKSHYEEIAQAIIAAGKKAGNLTIKRAPLGTNSNAIRALLKEYELTHSKLPTLLIVDYLDLMGTNEKVSADNISNKDKLATEELREIAVEQDMIIATASQQNRSGIDATEASQAHIAGGLTKINTVDITVSVTLNAQYKAQGRIWFQFTKTRSSEGVGTSVLSKWVNKFLRIAPPDDNDQDIIDAMHKLNNKDNSDRLQNKTWQPGLQNDSLKEDEQHVKGRLSSQLADIKGKYRKDNR